MESQRQYLNKNTDDIEDESTLHQLRIILANSTFNLNEFVSKSRSVNSIDSIDDDDYELMAFNEITKIDDDNDETMYKDGDGRISLAYERLPGIPQIIADKFAHKTFILDLSYNNFRNSSNCPYQFVCRLRDLSFLLNFKHLHTLILDNNVLISEHSLPYLPNLKILWLNKCGIIQLNKWLRRISIYTPNLRQLSLMGNPGVQSSINGGSTYENYDYIMCVICTLPNLEYLDDMKITDKQRAMARGYISGRALNDLRIQFRLDDFFTSTNPFITRKYDIKIRRYQTIHGNIIPQLMLNGNSMKN